jgi:parallel beta-helix repeat protein
MWRWLSSGCLVVVGALISAAPALGATTHSPIVITSDLGFTHCGCVVSGNGSTSNPYVIGPWSVTNPGGDGVYIDGTSLTKSFVVYDVSVNKSAGNGITLSNINRGTGPTIVAKVYGGQTTTNNNTWGIQVENSSGVVLDGVGVSSSGPGVAATGFATANTNRLGGIDLESSSDITVRGWQMNANGADAAPDWITLDPSTSYWSGGAIRMFKVTGSTIDHNAANNSSDGHFMLFDSTANTISNNTAGYPYTMNFLLTDGSSYNTLIGNDAWDGDYVGVLVADPLPGSSTLAEYGPSHDNLITDNNIHSNGPTGAEKKAGLVPAFVGGIVLLNDTYDNSVTNNSTYASTGTDLGWAQAVPDATTPIGIKTFPPLLHCNVTAYDATGSPPPFDGNVWSSNTYKTIDPCLPSQ